MIGKKKSIEDFTLSSLSLSELNRVLIRIGDLLSQAHGIGQAHDMHGSRIVNVGEPTQARDAINKGALDAGLKPKTEGPESSTDNAVARWDGTEGRHLQDSLAIVDDDGTVDIPFGQTYSIDGVPHTHALNDLSDVDFTDEAHGDILFRGASAWESLPAGEEGQILTTHGVDADPTWEAAAAGGLQELLVADIAAPIELAAISDPEDGDTILTYDSAGKFTVYCYETDATGDSPFVVSGWVAVAGEYSELSLNTHQLLVDTEPTEPNHVVRLADVTAGYWPAGYWPTGYWP